MSGTLERGTSARQHRRSRPTKRHTHAGLRRFFAPEPLSRRGVARDGSRKASARADAHTLKDLAAHVHGRLYPLRETRAAEHPASETSQVELAHALRRHAALLHGLNIGKLFVSPLAEAEAALAKRVISNLVAKISCKLERPNDGTGSAKRRTDWHRADDVVHQGGFLRGGGRGRLRGRGLSKMRILPHDLHANLIVGRTFRPINLIGIPVRGLD